MVISIVAFEFEPSRITFPPAPAVVSVMEPEPVPKDAVIFPEALIVLIVIVAEVAFEASKVKELTV
jgi:hypothetical protein